MTYDDWDIVGLVFCLSILAGFGVFWLVMWADKNNPLTRADRRQIRTVQRGKRAMASDR